MAVNPGLIPNYTNRGAIDRWIATNAGQYSPDQVNAIAQALSANTAGVSFQELQSRLAENAAQPQAAVSGGGGGGYYTPTVTANLSDRINALNQMYDLVYRDIADLTQSRKSELEKSYGTQQQGLTTQYEDTARALPTQYGALGIKNSSYYENAAKKASDVYNQSVSQLEQDRQAKMADLGKFYETTMGQFQAGQQAVGRTPQTITGTQADVTAAQSQLDQALQSLSGQRAGLKTNQQYMQSLQGIAPSQNMGADMLKKQLDELSVSSIPNFAKQTIGKDIIKKSGQDQTFYQDYFDKLQQGQSTGA
jgi:DNA-binding transcriptional MerR regulator